MISITLTPDTYRSFQSFLHREKDFLLSIRSMSQDILTPKGTGSVELISADLELIKRLQSGLRSDWSLTLTEADADLLLEIGSHNKFSDRQELWNELDEKITADLSGD